MWKLLKNKLIPESTQQVDASTNEPRRQEDASVSTAVQDAQLGTSDSNVTVAASIPEEVLDEAELTHQHWERNAEEKIPPTSIPTTAEFSLKLWKAVEKYGQTDVISPLGLLLAMAVAKAGARSTAADEITKVFNLPDDPTTARMCQNLIRELGLTAAERNYGLFLCNLLSAPLSLKFRETFADYAKKVFLFDAKNFDFHNLPKHSTQDINGIVRRSTKETLFIFLKKNDVGKGTKLVLINVAFFKGLWKKEFHFPTTNTRKEYFYNKDGSRVKVYMMAAKSNFKHVQIPQFRCSILAIPYEDIDCTFHIILPEETKGFKEIDRNLSSDFITTMKRRIESSVSDKIIVAKIPKFIASSQVNMVPILKKMGIDTMFSSSAHYQGYFENSLNGFFTNFYHQAYLEIHETGSECNHSRGESVSPTDTADFEANRPFLFLVMHDNSDTILLLGSVTNLATRDS